MSSWAEYFGVNFMPHGHCYLWRDDLLLLHTISDSLIVISYYSIPIALWVLVKKRKDLAFDWMFILFATFILACGTTHLIEIWNTWNGNYYLEGLAKAVTAAASVITAVLLWPLIPKLLELPSPAALRTSNDLLRQEINRREDTELALRRSGEELEARVAERTRQLEIAKQALEEEVRERRAAEERFRGLFQASPNGVMLIDEHDTIQLANLQAGTIFGYHTEDLKGMRMQQLIPSGYDGVHALVLQERLTNADANGAVVKTLGVEEGLIGIRQDAKRVPLEIDLSPLDTDVEVSVIASVVDITGRQRLEESVRQRNHDLQNMNYELQHFAFIASHDLREPLRKVLSFGRLLVTGRYGSLDEKGQEFTGYMLEAAERMQALLDSLLTYSRVTSKARPFEEVELNEVIADVRDDLQLAIVESRADIQCSILTSIDGDQTQLRQLFQNLISNSLKYRRPDVAPVIKIEGAVDREHYLIRVSDNGIGIDAVYREQIFDVFKRLHNRDEYEGTGMGLAICRKIVERHRGEIHVIDQVEQGTCFEVRLPVEQRSDSV
ncbi:sensor histidine kinase [Allohahella marinimesophila]|uniref:histidine kinase n=1 Tax=Allohahella marinimesophila TaxID=1054972 RepID=A0ABP7P0L2_9GAMM